MSELPGQEPLEGMPEPPEAPEPRTEDESIRHAEKIATEAEKRPHADTPDRPTRSEQEGGSVDQASAQASARAATKAARIAAAQAQVAAGGVSLQQAADERQRAKWDSLKPQARPEPSDATKAEAARQDAALDAQVAAALRKANERDRRRSDPSLTATEKFNDEGPASSLE